MASSCVKTAKKKLRVCGDPTWGSATTAWKCGTKNGQSSLPQS